MDLVVWNDYKVSIILFGNANQHLHDNELF